MFFCNREPYAKIPTSDSSNSEGSADMPFRKVFIIRNNIFQNTLIKKNMPHLPSWLTGSICMSLTYFVQARLRMAQDSKNPNAMQPINKL